MQPKRNSLAPSDVNEVRYWSKVRLDAPEPDYAPHLGPCHWWTACRSTSGYGLFGVRGVLYGAHRIAWLLHYGALPTQSIDHLCRVRHCVNPSHMEPVTDRINSERGEPVWKQLAARTHCKYGHEFTTENTQWRGRARTCRICARTQHRSSQHRTYTPRARTLRSDRKLSPEQIAYVRTTYAAGGRTMASLAVEMHVSLANIHRTIHREQFAS